MTDPAQTPDPANSFTAAAAPSGMNIAALEQYLTDNCSEIEYLLLVIETLVASYTPTQSEADRYYRIFHDKLMEWDLDPSYNHELDEYKRQYVLLASLYERHPALVVLSPPSHESDLSATIDYDDLAAINEMDLGYETSALDIINSWQRIALVYVAQKMPVTDFCEDLNDVLGNDFTSAHLKDALTNLKTTIDNVLAHRTTPGLFGDDPSGPAANTLA